MNKTLFAIIAAAVCLGGLYFGSPFYAVHELREASRKGDRARLEQTVDFPAVRDSMKSQLSAVMLKRMQSDPDMNDNPFAPLGALIMPAIIERMVDAYVTPDGISQMVLEGKAHAPTGESTANDGPTTEQKSNDKTEQSYAYASLDRFKVTFKNSEQPTLPLVMTMERRNLFSWRLVRIYLPLDALSAEDASAGQSSAPAVVSSAAP